MIYGLPMLALFVSLSFLLGCSDAARKESQRSAKAATSTNGVVSPTGASSMNSDGSPTGEAPGGSSAEFEQAGVPTPVSAAYLTAYRDAPTGNGVDEGLITVFAVVRDEKTGVPLPKPVAIDGAVVSFDDASEIAGTVDTDPKNAYHVVFKIPKAQLAAESIGKDRLQGAIKVSSAAFPGTTIATSIVIWLANLSVNADREDYGVVTLARKGEEQARIKLNVSVTGFEQPAQGALLKGLGGNLTVASASTCPKLSELTPQDLVADCVLELEPNGVVLLDRVLTITYNNGVREDFASVIIRGETALVLGPSKTGYDRLWVHEGKLLATAHRYVHIWNKIPERSGTPPDVVLGTGKFPPYDDATFGWALDLVVADGKLVITDFKAPRLMIWDKIPTVSAASADTVVSLGSIARTVAYDGQRLFVGERDSAYVLKYWDGIPTNGSGQMTVPNSAGQASGALWFQGGRYLESKNGRVRVWNAWPLVYDAPALELGNPSPPPASGAAKLYGATGAATDGTALAVADGAASRILVWETFPTAGTTPADFVLGQPDFESKGDNAYGADSAESLSMPSGLALFDGKLAIADTQNRRIVVRVLPRKREAMEVPAQEDAYLAGESSPGLLSFKAGIFELGVTDRELPQERTLAVEFSGNTTASVKSATFDGPDFAFVGGTYPGTGGSCGAAILKSCTVRVKVANRAQGRRKAKLTLGYENGAESRAASITLRANFQPVAHETYDVETSPMSMDYTRAIGGGDGGIVMTLGYCLSLFRPSGATPAFSGVPIKLGLDDEVGCPIDASGMGPPLEPWFARTFGSRLYVAAEDLFVYRNVPTVSGTPVDFRLDVALRSEINSEAFVDRSASSVLELGGRLYVGTCAPAEILVWSTVPNAAGVAPDFIIPMPNPAQCVADLFAVDGKLVAGLQDDDAEGLLGASLAIWSTPPATIAAATSIFPILSPDYDYDPAHLGRFAWDGTRLYAVDTRNHGVKVWMGLPAAGQAPDFVLGHVELDGTIANDGGIGRWSFDMPIGVEAQGGRVYVFDRNGIKAFPYPTP